MNGLKLFLISTIAIVVLVFLLQEKNTTNTDGTSQKTKELRVFCAAGLRVVYEKIAKDFQKEYGVKISTEYRGSGHLLGSIKLQPGDVFIAADSSYTEIARKNGFVKEILPLARQYPVIVLPIKSDIKIETIKDLVNPNLKLSMSNPEAASIGKLIKKVFEKENIWAEIEKNTTNYYGGVFKPTVTEVANDVKMEAVDAGIVWNAIANQKNYKTYFKVIEDPILKNHREEISVGVLNSSENPTLALKFARYLHAADKGQIHFKASNYESIENADTWQEVPEIYLMSGGVNRIAIEDTLKEFEKREGAVIKTTYNGCGILVAQMKGGERPDAYFACDTSFVTQVSDLFQPYEELTSTELVIAVKKGNPLNIKSVNDLTNPNIRVGLANPVQSALGALTKGYLTNLKIFEQVFKNASSNAPGGEILISQLVPGSLDACIVYKANTTKAKNEIEVVKLDITYSEAKQPFAISNKTKNHYITNRLLDSLKEQKIRFSKAGFNYIANKENTE